MMTIIEANENSAVINIPFDELEKLGFAVGDEVEFLKKKDEVVLRPKRTERAEKVLAKTREIIERRKSALIELGKGHE